MGKLFPIQLKCHSWLSCIIEINLRRHLRVYTQKMKNPITHSGFLSLPKILRNTCIISFPLGFIRTDTGVYLSIKFWLDVTLFLLIPPTTLSQSPPCINPTSNLIKYLVLILLPLLRSASNREILHKKLAWCLWHKLMQSCIFNTSLFKVKQRYNCNCLTLIAKPITPIKSFFHVEMHKKINITG